jgi:hypothetical protein
VVALEVQFEGFPAVADFAAFLLLLGLELVVGWVRLLVVVVDGLLGAAPDLELEVLAVFVPLPVVFAAEPLVALGEGAGVGFCVAF